MDLPWQVVPFFILSIIVCLIVLYSYLEDSNKTERNKNKEALRLLTSIAIFFMYGISIGIFWCFKYTNIFAIVIICIVFGFVSVIVNLCLCNINKKNASSKTEIHINDLINKFGIIDHEIGNGIFIGHLLDKEQTPITISLIDNCTAKNGCLFVIKSVNENTIYAKIIEY